MYPFLILRKKLDILSVGGDKVTDEKNTSKQEESYSKTDRINNDRHNDNARAAADLQSNTPRINTDNL
jgi:hypothetical protein